MFGMCWLACVRWSQDRGQQGHKGPSLAHMLQGQSGCLSHGFWHSLHRGNFPGGRQQQRRADAGRGLHLGSGSTAPHRCGQTKLRRHAGVLQLRAAGGTCCEGEAAAGALDSCCQSAAAWRG